MIVVVTLNPAVDVTHHVANADWAGVNRPHAVHARAGGKGVNVARVLCGLGQRVLLAGLAGGAAGQALGDGLAGTGIDVQLTAIAGETRRTFAVTDVAREQTALFNEPGPSVGGGEYEEFFVHYEKAMQGADAVVLSGSLPAGLPDHAYAGLIAAAAGAGVPAILDASGAALRLGAAAGPALVKPNLAELGEATGQHLGSAGEPDMAAAERAARDLVAQGGAVRAGTAEPLPAARPVIPGAGAAGPVVVVSLGSHGLVAVDRERSWRASPPEPVAGNPTGAGDAVVAGLADGLVRGRAWTDLLRHATALGTASAAAPVAGEFSLAEYQRLVPVIRVEERA